MAPSGLYARLCHAFLVLIFVDSEVKNNLYSNITNAKAVSVRDREIIWPVLHLK